MPDEKPLNPKAPETPDLRAPLIDAWEQIHVLLEKIDDLDLQQTATLTALVKAVPGFADEYERAYKAILENEKNNESELPPIAREAFRRLRKRQT